MTCVTAPSVFLVADEFLKPRWIFLSARDAIDSLGNRPGTVWEQRLWPSAEQVKKAYPEELVNVTPIYEKPREPRKVPRPTSRASAAEPASSIFLSPSQGFDAPLPLPLPLPLPSAQRPSYSASSSVRTRRPRRNK